jgi:hypothetical protein
MPAMSSSLSIIGSCINCTSSANLAATFALIVLGFGLATYYELGKSGV